MVRTSLPTIERLTLARVTAVPEWHPEHSTFEPFAVHAWIVRHRDGIVLFDTGIGLGHEQIEEWYRPEITPLAEALAASGTETSDITIVVLSHLHFDHCGQHTAVDAPVYVQAAELEAAQAPGYTVAEWATIPRSRLRIVDGDEEILNGVRLVPTPGHTPGHQSVVVDTDEGIVVLAGQCAFTAPELHSGRPSPSNLHDDEWHDSAVRSLALIRSLKPIAVHLSHDPDVVALR